MGRLQDLGKRVHDELAFYRLVLAHPNTPRLARWLLGLAIGYLLLPIDLIPDFIPVLGHIDDAVIVPGLIILALRRIPPDVIRTCRQQASQRSPR